MAQAGVQVTFLGDKKCSVRGWLPPNKTRVNFIIVLTVYYNNSYQILLVQIFEGNWDSNTTVTHYFYAPVVAQYVRIKPQTWETHIAIRFELLGCKCKYAYHFDEYPRYSTANASNLFILEHKLDVQFAVRLHTCNTIDVL